jgi:hypothetical protein
MVKSEEEELKKSAPGRNRTGTFGKEQRILSPQRLPIPPPEHHFKTGI